MHVAAKSNHLQQVKSQNKHKAHLTLCDFTLQFNGCTTCDNFLRYYNLSQEAHCCDLHPHILQFLCAMAMTSQWVFQTRKRWETHKNQMSWWCTQNLLAMAIQVHYCACCHEDVAIVCYDSKKNWTCSKTCNARWWQVIFWKSWVSR